MQNPQDITDGQLVRCEVTGEMIPLDETVVINGLRVSAQGKAILMDQLKTGDNMPGELEAPGSLRRFGCAVLDGLLLGGVGMLLGFASVGVSAALSEDSSLPILVQSVAELLATVVAVIYFTALHTIKGQSLGKMLGKYRVTNLQGAPITFSQALIRAMAFTGVQAISPIVMILLFLAGMIGANEGILVIAAVIGVVVGLYSFGNAICVLVHPQKRAIHDLLAGTRAVMNDE